MNAKTKKIAVIIAAVIVAIILLCVIFKPGDDNREDPANTSDTSISTVSDTTTEKQTESEWKTIMELSGTEQEKLSEVFTLNGGSVRIKYEIETETKGEAVDSGTSLIYILKDGTTKAKDADGNLRIATQDVTVIGSKNAVEIVQKEAGNYYLDINTSSVKSYKIIVEEKQK